MGAHVFYELGAGVAVPLASRVGIVSSASGFAAATVLASREAGRRSSRADPAFCAVNGLYLAAVIGHFASWPRRSRVGVPWLEECEGLRGAVVQPYNVILHASAVAAVGGLVENRHGRVWGALMPVVVVPLLVRATPREFERLVAQAAARPRWWNRRLAARQGATEPEGGRGPDRR